MTDAGFLNARCLFYHQVFSMQVDVKYYGMEWLLPIVLCGLVSRLAAACCDVHC